MFIPQRVNVRQFLYINWPRFKYYSEPKQKTIISYAKGDLLYILNSSQKTLITAPQFSQLSIDELNNLFAQNKYNCIIHIACQAMMTTYFTMFLSDCDYLLMALLEPSEVKSYLDSIKDTFLRPLMKPLEIMKNPYVHFDCYR